MLDLSSFLIGAGFGILIGYALAYLYLRMQRVAEKAKTPESKRIESPH
jgi:NhaP-type Na+/H+ or K+/H+ antiporter